MPRAARAWSSSSAIGCAAVRISPKASPPSAKNANRSTGRQSDVHIAASRRKPGPTYPLLSRLQGGPRLSPGRRFACFLRGVIREDDGGDKGPGLDKAGFRRFPSELFHRAQQAEPVQHLVLA